MRNWIDYEFGFGLLVFEVWLGKLVLIELKWDIMFKKNCFLFFFVFNILNGDEIILYILKVYLCI